MKFDLIDKANTITSLDKDKMNEYETLSHTLQKDIFSLIEADATFSKKITDNDYKQWIVQAVMDLPRVRTTKSNFCEALLNVLENDPAGKVNLGDDQLVRTVCDIAWNKYKVIIAEMNLAKQEEEEELVDFIKGGNTQQDDGANEVDFGDMGSEGEPASSSQRMRSHYEENPTHNSFDDDDASYDALSLDQLQDENNQLAQLIQSTRELIDQCKQMKNKEIRPEPTESKPAQQTSSVSIEDEEVSKITSKRNDLIKQYNEVNAQAQEASRQARLKAAQAKQLDKAISDLDKEVIKQGESNFKR